MLNVSIVVPNTSMDLRELLLLAKMIGSVESVRKVVEYVGPLIPFISLQR